MANRLRVFMLPEDERAFLLGIERLELEVYPRRIPPDWQPFKASGARLADLPEEELYLAATSVGPVTVDKFKRGKDKGFWRVDEVRSPVIFFERSRLNEEGELLSGLLWAELDVTPQTGRRDPAPDRFRRLWMEMEEWLKKTFRKSDPPQFLVGPHAARQHKQGLVLRDNEHRGGTVDVWK